MKYFWLLALPAFLYSLTIYSPKAAPALPLLRLTNQANVVFYQDVSTEIIPRLAKREEALYIIPANVAAKLYTKTPDLRLVGITSIGMLSLLTTNHSYKNWESLVGKQVYIGAPGSSPDTVSRVLFRAAGIMPEIVYADSPQIAQMMIAGKIENAVLPEPLASLVIEKNPTAKILKTYREEWNTFFKTKTGVPQTAIVSFAGFLEKNTKNVTAFLQAYQKEVAWVNNSPSEASSLGITGLGISIPTVVLQKSIPRMGLTYLPARLMRKEIILYLQELMKVDPETVGKIPDDTFFAW